MAPSNEAGGQTVLHMAVLNGETDLVAESPGLEVAQRLEALMFLCEPRKAVLKGREYSWLWSHASAYLGCVLVFGG